MSDKLLKASNAVWVKEQSVSELIDENVSLNRKNRLLWAGLIGLSALSCFSISSCRKNAKDLESVQRENGVLKSDVSALVKKGHQIYEENIVLRDYAEDAQSFALGLRPWLDENDSGCEDPNCAACKKMEKENDKKLDEFSKAMDTLNIDEKILFRLQEGWQAQK